ncbi:MAG: FtsX-like permease family protein [Roseivirga sp.]|nr:FtsX-like permease family protein [Roseivirga sp.]
MKKYFVGLWRHLKRNKAFALINISGLTIGITCSLVMFLIVKYELGYDKFHKNYDNLYRVTSTRQTYETTSYSIGVPKPLPQALKEDIAGLEESAFFSHARFGQFVVKDKNGQEKEFIETSGLVYTEPSFFKMFDWQWVEGNAESLAEPNTVVLDDVTAERYFPDGDALGQVMNMNGSTDLKVVGIVKERPKQSDFPFSVIVSLTTINSSDDFTNWYSTNSNDRCYVLINSNTELSSITSQFEAFVDKYHGEKSTVTYDLQGLSEVHFDKQYGNLNYRGISWDMIYTLSGVSLLMILTACFNFINMSTAVALKRAREVGIKKVLGSTRLQLVYAFLLETFAITLVSMCGSLALAERLLPGIVSDFVRIELKLNLWSDPILMVYLVVLLVFITSLAGLYPAWLISGFKPSNVLKSNTAGMGGKSLNLRRVLVVFQFSLSQVFIVGTLIALYQMNYVKNADLGFNQDQVVTLNLPQGNAQQDVWQSVLESNTGVKDFSFAMSAPFSGMSSSTDAEFTQDTTKQRFTTFLKPADAGYIDTYKLELLEGEGLLDSDKANRYVINEAFLHKMGFQNPADALGTMLKVGGREAYPISGVVKDFNMTSLKIAIKPAVIFSDKAYYSNLGLKLTGNDTQATLDKIEITWKELYPDQDFNPSFMDEYIVNYYQADKKYSEMLMTFSVVAILISCLGLYGMISYMANQRVKEIGIRKVLGASVQQILLLFSKEFTRLAIIAFLIAAPLAYWGMLDWLNNFVYKISIGPSVFVAGIATSLAITLLTIGYRALRAGNVNPVESLRD